MSASARAMSASAASAQHDVVPALALEAEARRLRPIDDQHIGAHVGEQHPGEGRGADCFEFQYPDTVQRTHGATV